MPVPTDKLAEDIDGIRTDLSALQGDFREFRAEARVVIGLLKWIGGAVVISLLTQAAAAICYAAKLDSRVGNHGDRIERLERLSDAKLTGPASAK